MLRRRRSRSQGSTSLPPSPSPSSRSSSSLGSVYRSTSLQHTRTTGETFKKRHWEMRINVTLSDAADTITRRRRVAAGQRGEEEEEETTWWDPPAPVTVISPVPRSWRLQLWSRVFLKDLQQRRDRDGTQLVGLNLESLRRGCLVIATSWLVFI